MKIFGAFIVGLTLVACASAPEKLIRATHQGDLNQIRRIVATDTDVQLSDLSHVLPIAAAYNRRDILELLIRSGANVNATNYGRVEKGEHRYHAPPLFVAVANGYEDITELLIRSGARVQITGSLWKRSSSGWKRLESEVSPLYIAASKNYKNILKLLLNQYKNTESDIQADALAAILVAARLRQTGTVDLLIEAGTDTQQAYRALSNNADDDDAREIIKDRSRRKILVLSPYHSLIDQCDALQSEAKEAQKRYVYNRLNRKLRSLSRKCSRVTLRRVCGKAARGVPYKERKSLLKQCTKNAARCCSNCNAVEDYDSPYRCYSKQSLFAQ